VDLGKLSLSLLVEDLIETRASQQASVVVLWALAAPIDSAAVSHSLSASPKTQLTAHTLKPPSLALISASSLLYPRGNVLHFFSFCLFSENNWCLRILGVFGL
jgi:hypothetical protein